LNITERVIGSPQLAADDALSCLKDLPIQTYKELISHEATTNPPGECTQQRTR
jgi:hypothetical protein